MDNLEECIYNNPHIIPYKIQITNYIKESVNLCNKTESLPSNVSL